jgi:hypothetical protein
MKKIIFGQNTRATLFAQAVWVIRKKEFNWNLIGNFQLPTLCFVKRATKKGLQLCYEVATKRFSRPLSKGYT